jgi:ubiquinone/menaquinone biosynthesis C-methylase UbiE
LATYLTLAYHPREFVGLDVRPDFVEAARKAVDGFEIPGLSFTEGDMHDLRNVPDGSADLILANNAFIYLPTQREQMQALKAFRRVLAPGGHVVLYHANRWVWREPFTGSPAVHLLPPMLARRVAGVFGWKHNVGRVRYPSPFEMRRMLLRAGFRRVRYGAPRGKAVNSGPGSRFSRFYGIGAGGPGRGGA